MPEHKDVVLALLATATGLGAVLLVFQGLLLTIIGNAPLPEATTWTASLAHMLHSYYTILRIAVGFTLVVFLVTMVVIGLAVWWLLFGGDALYQQICNAFFFVLFLIAGQAVISTVIVILKRVTPYDPV